MAVYYMGEDVTKSKAIKGVSGIPSEYQDLIDDYLAKGGTITKVPAGRRARDDDWERVSVGLVQEEFEKVGRENYGQALFDRCVVDTKPDSAEDYLDNSEKIRGGF